MVKLSTDIGKTIKQNTVKGVTSALFGSGALGKAIASKFEDKEEKDTRVAQALIKQNQLFKDNNVTLARIQTLTANISQNIANIAEVMGAQLNSTKEAQRIQQENISRKQAASEEGQNETQKIQAPSPAGTPPTQKEEEKKKSSLIDSVSSTKKLMGALLKKFALVGGGLLLAGGAAMAASSLLSPSDIETSQENIDGIGQGEAASAEPAAAESVTPDTNPADFFTRMGGPKVGGEMAPFLQAGESGNMNDFVAAAQKHAAANPPPPPPPPPTPVAPPPSVAATAQPSSEDKIKELEERIAANERRLASRKQGQERQMQHFTKKYGESDPDRLKELQADSDKGIKEYEKMVEDSNAGIRKTIEDLKSKKSSSTSPMSSSSMAPSNSPSESSSATPQQSTPSSGADVITASTSVAAASEQRTSGEQVISTTTNSSPPGSSEITQIPSPIANRGSLDVGVTFDAGM